MDLHEHLQTQPLRPPREFPDELEGLRHHEAALAGSFERITDRVQPDYADAVIAEGAQNAVEVLDDAWVRYIDVHLFGSERRPEDPLTPVLQRDCRERQTRCR